MSAHKIVLNALRLDAAHSAFIDQQLQALEAELYRVQYTDLKARLWLPPKGDVPAGAETFAYRILDGVGDAAIGHHQSDDMPGARVRVEKKVGRIETVFNSFGYTKQELRAAAMANMPLDNELAMVQMRAHEERFNELTLVGNAALGWHGLFNHPDIPVIAGGASDWDNSGTSGLTILADLRKLYNQVVAQSRGIFVPNQIVLPLSSYLAAQAKPLGQDFSATDNALSAFARTTATPVEIGWDVNLETAGANGAKRAVAFQKSERTAQYVQPLAPEIGEPQLRGLEYVRTIESRVGELALKQNLAFAYLDGL